MSADLHTFAKLALASRCDARSGVKLKSRVVLPTGHTSISRALIHERLRRCWRIDWTPAQVDAVIAELVERGAVVKTSNGFRAADWDVIATIAKGAAA